jgi:nucleotide-binding universal stress UspA family protein
VLFGVIAMLRTDAWHVRFTSEFMPNGFRGVLQAMGLTFIAFEGYEIIAQSGEEVKNPKRNIPRAIFSAILIAVVIYILVGTVAIGAAQAPAGLKTYEYLGQQKEVAIVQVAQQTFPWGIGAIVLIFSGLVSTMSALNATTYSSSRVSFAMGRDRNLPAFFARIHPQRHTPHLAVLASGALMLVMAWSLPIEAVAASADIMFLLLFFQVNVAVMTLRHKLPNLERGYHIPWYPMVPIIGLITKGFLAVYLFSYSPVAWYSALAWIVVGLLAYYAYFSKIEAMDKPKEILLEEVLVSRDYSVLVPVADQAQARILGTVGAILAQANQGEVLALHVVKVPPQLTLGEGRLLLREGRSYLQTVIQHCKARQVPVHSIIRLGRNPAEAVRKTVEENASDLLVLGWPGYTLTVGRLFGSVIDPIVDDPPTDIVLVRYRHQRPVGAVLVPVGGGLNSRLAVKLAVGMAQAGEHGPAKVTLLHVIPVGAANSSLVRAQQALRNSREGIEYDLLAESIAEGANVVETVLAQAEGYDLIVIGATNEPLFKNLLVGNIPEQVAQQAVVTVVMVKQRSSPFHSFLRQTVLEPTTRGDQT